MRKLNPNSVGKLLVVAFAAILIVNSAPVAARVIPWAIANCAEKPGAAGCESGARKGATTEAPNVGGYAVKINATLTHQVKVVVTQTNAAYGDLRVTFYYNNVGTSPPTFERKRGNKWEAEAGRPSDYQASWVNQQVAGLQKQDPDFSFSDR